MKTMVRLGEDVKIQCPISGNPTPIIEWKKGGETIDYTFIRIRTKGRQLRIKKSQETDTGVFICKGVNGFGNVEVRVDLIVIGKLETILFISTFLLLYIFSLKFNTSNICSSNKHVSFQIPPSSPT